MSIEASKYDSYEFSDIVVQEGSPVNADMHVNVYDRFVYVMTTRRVSVPFSLLFSHDTTNVCVLLCGTLYSSSTEHTQHHLSATFEGVKKAH